MKTLYDYIFEAQIDGLKDVKIIRHYSTGYGLKEILKSGKLMTSKSIGDSEWEGYDLHDDYVVSFHDVRTDPEYKTIIEQNKKNEWHSGVWTLGQHADKICCCIEIDYDKLDKLIQDKTHLLNIYGQKAIDFCNLWNFLVNFKEIQEEIIGSNDTILDLIELKNNKSDDELSKSIDFLFNNYDNIKFNNKKAKLAWKKVEEIFRKNFPNIKNLYKDGGWFIEQPGKMSGEKYYDNFIECVFKYICDEIDIDDEEDLNDYKKEIKLRSDFFKRDLKKFTEEEAKILSEYSIKFDVISIVKMLKNHGWRFGDSLLDEFSTSNGWGEDARTKKQIYWDDQDEEDWYDGSLISWIDQLSKSKNRIINANIEIRIGSDIKLNKENCKIVIFEGLCNATKQKSIINFAKKYQSKYNIEIIPPIENKSEEE